MSAELPLVEALKERYAIERELGHGGMATVSLARGSMRGTTRFTCRS